MEPLFDRLILIPLSSSALNTLKHFQFSVQLLTGTFTHVICEQHAPGCLVLHISHQFITKSNRYGLSADPWY